jgi:hypothetical protein
MLTITVALATGVFAGALLWFAGTLARVQHPVRDAVITAVLSAAVVVVLAVIIRSAVIS